ncbi:hypothetical protein AB0C52_24705 [Streptomyces sp. NPDC048717]|uniref:hypothetical protein n=1 Tax=Streptomyces sp. NPDC048717 TaxID=3154928 RepID=UPI00342F245B
MPMPRLLGPWPVRVDEGQFCLTPAGDIAEVPEARLERALDHAYDTGGLIGSHHDTVCVLTGINCGEVLLSVLRADTDPGPDKAPWDDIAEAPLHAPAGTLHYTALMGNTGEEPQEPYETNLAHAGPGEYRLRLHARGRSINPDGVQGEGEPVTEHYLLQLWPQRALPT